MKKCKYYNKHLITINELISCLYNLEECECGGILHIVTDNDNLDDGSIKYCIEECYKEENKDREEIELAKLICNELLKLSIQERSLLRTRLTTKEFECCFDCRCEDCCIERGELYPDMY